MIGSLVGNIIYQAIIVCILVGMFHIAPFTLMIIAGPWFPIGLIAGIFTFIIGPIMIISLYIISIVPMINGCIRYTVRTNKSVLVKIMLILLSLCLIINIVVAIVFIIKSKKSLKMLREAKAVQVV